MDRDFLKDTVTNTMNVYKTAFEEGRKVGYLEGYKKGSDEARDIAIKVIKEA